MDQFSSTYDWNICFLCQTDTKELCRSTEEGHNFLSVVLLQFDALDIDLNK